MGRLNSPTTAGALIVLTAFFVCDKGLAAPADWRVYQVSEVRVEAAHNDDALLAEAVFLLAAGDRLFVVDRGDHAVKVFDYDGRFLRKIGRKGRGPGEFENPSGVCRLQDRLFVADAGNRRVQVLNEEGVYISSFKLPFQPDKVHLVDGNLLLVTRLAGGRGVSEKAVHIFDLEGRQVGACLDSLVSGDPVLDSLRNLFFVLPGEEGGFFVVHVCDNRQLLRFSGEGRPLGRVSLDERYKGRRIDLSPTGKKEKMTVLCWSCVRADGLFYILTPEALEGGDVGPGRVIYSVSDDGRVVGEMGLPDPVARIAVSGSRIFAVDAYGGLRIFEFGR